MCCYITQPSWKNNDPPLRLLHENKRKEVTAWQDRDSRRERERKGSSRRLAKRSRERDIVCTLYVCVCCATGREGERTRRVARGRGVRVRELRRRRFFIFPSPQPFPFWRLSRPCLKIDLPPPVLTVQNPLFSHSAKKRTSLEPELMSQGKRDGHALTHLVTEREREKRGER